MEIRTKRIDDHEIKNGKIQMLMSAKAITKNEVRKEMDMPLTKEDWGKEIAGEEGGQEQQPGMPGMPGQGQGPEQPEERTTIGTADEGMEPANAQAEAEREEPKEIGESRPRTNTLGRGALGLRKSLNGGTKKVFANGKH